MFKALSSGGTVQVSRFQKTVSGPSFRHAGRFAFGIPWMVSLEQVWLTNAENARKFIVPRLE